MAGIENNVTIKITPKLGITHALLKYAQENKMTFSDGSISDNEWYATLDKLAELQQARQKNNQKSIFTGGTDRKDYKTSFVVHPDQEIEFTKEEINTLFDAMGASFTKKPGSAATEEKPETETPAVETTVTETEEQTATEEVEEQTTEEVEEQTTEEVGEQTTEEVEEEETEESVENDPVIAAKGADGKYKLKFDITNDPDYEGECTSAIFQIEANTEEEFRDKLTKMQELKGIKVYDANYSDEEKEKIKDILIADLQSGDKLLQYAASTKFKALSINILNNEHRTAITDVIIDSKDSGILDRTIGDYNVLDLSEKRYEKLYNLTKDKDFIKDCKDNKREYVINNIKTTILKSNITPTEFKKQIIKESSNGLIENMWCHFLDKTSVMELMNDKELKLSNKAKIRIICATPYKYSADEMSQLVSKMGILKGDENFEQILNNKLQDADKDKFHIVKKGETLDNIVADYVLKKGIIKPLREVVDKEALELAKNWTNKDGLIAEQLKNGKITLDDMTERDGKKMTYREFLIKTADQKKIKWTEERQKEAAKQYLRDFRDTIANQLGLKSNSSSRFSKNKYNNLQTGQIIDFNKIQEWPQPSSFSWKLWY